MKKILLILPLAASISASAQNGEATLVVKNKPLYNLTLRLPFTTFLFQDIDIDEWQKVNPDYVNLSANDASWTSYSNNAGVMSRGRTGGTGIMAGINFSPVDKRGRTRIVYGVEAGYLTSQAFSTSQYKSYSKVIDTVSFSSGSPDQYVVQDSTLYVEYAYSASRVVLSPRIGVYFNQLKRLGFGVGVSGSAGISVGSRISKTTSNSVGSSTVDDPSQPTEQYIVSSERSSYSSVSETQSVKSSANFSGGAFGEINYRLGKTGGNWENYRLGLELQAGVVASGIAGKINRTTPYYSTALTFAYTF